MRKFHEKLKKGQSLVELALFLPLFLVIVGGLVEVGQFLVIKNRVDTAANLAARFGANGGQNEGMASVAINSITQTLPVQPDQWDIWAFRGQVNELGTEIDPNTFEYEHVYGDGNTNLYTAFADQETELRASIYDELVSTDIEGNTDQERIQDVQFAGTLVVYDAESILNLNTVLSDVYSVQALHVMRTFPSSDSSNGCSAFPLAIDRGNRSLNATNFPATGAFEYPSGGLTLGADFPRNVIEVPIEQASPGSVYRFYNRSTGSGNFNWVTWNEGLNGTSMQNLERNLAWPGRSTDYGNNGAVGNAVDGSGYSFPVYGYIEPGDPTDQAIHIGDRIAGAAVSGNLDGIKTIMQDHINRDRTLRFIVYDPAETVNGQYLVYGFAVIRVAGYDLSSGTDSWILGEFVSWDNSCGQQTFLPGMGGN